MRSYLSCVTESLPNSTNVFDQLMNNVMNMTERITEMEAKFNSMCSADITSNVK